MASSVFYKFKSRKDEARVTFDGTGISIFDLKKAIIVDNNLVKAFDFDLHIYDRTSEQEFKDDGEIIPRSSSVTVKRRPAARPGRGSATVYLASLGASGVNSDNHSGNGTGGSSWHRGAMSKRFDSMKDEGPGNQTIPSIPSGIAQDEEAAAMAAMFQAQTANWEETQEKMSHATYIPFTGGRGGRQPNPTQRPQQHRQSDRPLPASYVCYRCGKKGHWIQDCPTNNDREFDHRPRIKRTTGIPRSFLKAVENPTNAQGVMVTPEGGFVVAQPDVAAWQKHLARTTKILTESDVRERPPSDPSLTCPIDRKLFRDAVRTPCCARTYCEECVQTHLLERDFICPGCGKRIASLDKLEKDEEARTKVKGHILKIIEDSKNEVEDGPKEIVEASGAVNTLGAAATDLDQTADSEAQQQADENLAQVIADSVPQLQAQVQQLALHLQNPNLPPQVRQQTELQHSQLQMQLQHAQTIALALAAANAGAGAANVGADVHAYQQAGEVLSGGVGLGMPTTNMGMGMGMGGAWAGPFNAQQNQGDGAYQRLPVNNRRRNLKRDRPSDFVEVAGSEGDAKQARYWE